MYCSNCGAPYNEGALFCESCGAKLVDQQAAQAQPAGETVTQTPSPAPTPAPNYTNQTQYQNGSGSYQYQTPPPNMNQPYGQQIVRNTYGIQNRSIALAIVLSIVTCGIYGIYWMIKLNDEINQLAGEDSATSGIMVLVFTLITCGIYGLFWQYKMGERVDRIKGANGNSGLIFLVLSFFGLGIVGYCLMQDTINKSI